MKLLLPIWIAFLISGCTKEPVIISSKTFPAGSLGLSDTIQNTLSNVIDGGEVVVFEGGSDVLIAVVEDFDNNRILVSFGAGIPSEGDFVINDKIYPKRKYKRCLIRHYGTHFDEHGPHEDKSSIVESHIGLMFPLHSDDTFSMKAKWEMNDFTYDLALSYDFKNGWNSGITSNPRQ